MGGGVILAGTSIGGGMLSLPLVSAGLGFLLSCVIMVILWALMTYTALLMLEVHQHADSSATLDTLATKFLGRKGKFLAALTMLFLFYSLSAAYIAGGGSQLTEEARNLLSIDFHHSLGAMIFSVLVAVVVVVGTHLVDRVNRVLFLIMIVAMAFVLLSLAPNVRGQYLASASVRKEFLMTSIPISFTSFGFHGSIPAIVKYFGGKTNELKKAVLIGSSVPLIIYIVWLSCTLGVVSQEEMLANASLNKLILSLSEIFKNSKLALIVNLFANLALITSFLGVSLGLFEFIRDITKPIVNGNRLWVAIITNAPPLCFALFYPEGFILALGYASIALVILAVLFPVAMAIKTRQLYKNRNCYRVDGGNVLPALSLFCGVLIIISQLLN